MTKPPADYRIQNLATFRGFTTIENIDKFYNKKYQTWLYNNSHTKEIIQTDSEDTYPRYDSKGNIINAKFSCTTKHGILLSEKDFIDSEISSLNNLEASNLSFEYKKRIEYYKDYLNSKLTGTRPGKKKDKSFEDFLFNINDKENFVKDLKKIFPSEYGQDIKAMILILQEEGILIINDREFKKLYDCIKNSFDQYIGTYPSVNDPKTLHPTIMSPIRSKLNPLISKYKQTS